MKSYIAVVGTSTQNQPPNTQQNNEFPLIGNNGAVGAVAVISAIAGKTIPWGEITKLFVGTRSSKVLMEENRKNQELEGEIDINLGLSNTLSGIAKETVTTAMGLLEKSVSAAQLYAEATASTNKATEHLTSATRDLIDAFNALTLAQSREGQETRKELKKVSEGQELTQENIASAVTTINGKLVVVIENQEEIIKAIAKLEENLDKAIAALKTELVVAVTSLR